MSGNASVPGSSVRAEVGAPALEREIGWGGAFWIASGVPALLLFSVGFIVVLNGPVAVAVWIVSVLIGIGMAFVYAEMAGLFPEKSGGPPVFGAVIWRRYAPLLPPLSIWGYWFAWTPVISIGGLLIGSYVVGEWIPSATWSLDFGPFHVTPAFLIGAGVVLVLLWLNHFGLRESAIQQFVLGIASLVPLTLMIVVPLLRGRFHIDNLTPFVPPSGEWTSWSTFAAIAGGLFVAGWSAYAFETAVVYTAEFRNPERDTPRAIFSSGGLCLLIYGLSPLVLVGVVGVEKIVEDPATAYIPLARATFGRAGAGVLIALLLVALVLSINTAILGSARTLYQAGHDGWALRFFGGLSSRGVPLKAMWYDVVVNLILMLLGSVAYVLAASTIGYMVSNVLELNAGWLARRDAPNARRPYRAPKVLMNLGLLWAAINFVLLFVGAPLWGWGAVGLGWAIVASGLVLYGYRTWQDRQAGRLAAAREESDVLGPVTKWANLTPMALYLAAVGGILTAAAGYGQGWLYVLGLGGTAIWLLGFALRRPGRRWWAW